MSTPMPRAVMTTVLTTLALCLSILVVAPAATAQSADRFETQARSLTNEHRADRNMPRLRYGRCVQRFAERQARRMARQTRMYHQDLGRVLNACDLRAVAENVAVGYPSGRSVVRGWMNSPGHRANMLNRSYRRLGMATRRGSDGAHYSVQVFGRR